MTKRWTAYFASASASAAAAFFAAAAGMYIIAAAVTVLLAWWTLYYRRLGYSRCGNILTVNSGVIIRRERRVRASEILWLSRAALRLCGDNTIYTAIHTVGGVIVIFGEFSTEGLSGF